jgi:hypothetical protein
MQILVELDGVLRDSDDKPIPIGVVMASTLTAFNRLTYLSSSTKEETEYWLNIHKIVDFDNIVDKAVELEGEDLVERQIKHARSRGPVDLFITGNPHHWAFAFDLGIASSMFAMPSYTRPEFRPDAPSRVRAWNDIEEAIERQNEVRTKDLRLTRTESLMFE